MQGVCYTTGVVGGVVDKVVEGVYPHPILVQVGGGGFGEILRCKGGRKGFTHVTCGRRVIAPVALP
jgi:hypothetical protein